MSGDHTTAPTAMMRWFPPNPFKHGVLLGMQDGKKKAITRDERAVTQELLSAHLLGQDPHLGYLPGGSEGTTTGAIDLDGKNFGDRLEEAKQQVIDAAARAGLSAFAERSVSGNGFHLWLWSDVELPYTEMASALKELVRRAGLPGNTETYPMSGSPKSRWIFMPYFGALAAENGLGRTHLVDSRGHPIPVSALDDCLRANDVGVLKELAAAFGNTKDKQRPVRAVTAPAAPHADAQTTGVAALLGKIARQKAPRQRHDALMAFLNLAYRGGCLEEVAASLKRPDLLNLWCPDGSRTASEWEGEIVRLAQSIGAHKDEEQPMRGIPYLRDEGYDVSGLNLGESGDGGKADSEKRGSVSARALELVQRAGGEPWRDEHGGAYLSVPVDGRLEHHRLGTRGARDFITDLMYDAEARPISAQALGEAMSVLEAMARRKGEVYPTGLRVKAWNDRVYLDLGQPTWTMVEVGASGWRVIPAEACPVRFIRSAQMLPLPTPVEGGDLQELAGLLNTDTNGRVLVIAFLLAALAARGPYPHLAFKGEQGVGKSTAASTLQRLIDPSTASRRRAPRKEQDLFIAARSAHVLSFDNLSSIPGDLSDSLCCLSTGGSFATRTLHTNDEETVLQAMRPAILNGIADLLTRADLAERTLLVELHRIDPAQRLTEQELEARFNQAHPRLLGALLTALATGLGRLGETRLDYPPRLADFATLVVAAEPALPWEPGTFMQVYTAMQDEAARVVLEGDEVAEALRSFLDERGRWEGPVQRLLTLLNEREEYMSGLRRVPPNWPRNARALGERLRRVAPALSKTGYCTTFVGRKKDGLYYRLTKASELTFTTDTHET